MTDKRTEFIDYVLKDSDKRVFSPQIGGGAGFAAKIAGKEWLSKTTLHDIIDATNKFNMLPLFNMGLPGIKHDDLNYKHDTFAETENRIKTITTLNTPVGSLESISIEEKFKGGCPLESFVKTADDLKILEYYLDAAMDADLSEISKGIKKHIDIIDGRGALSIQWAMQPYELLCFPNTVNTMLLSLDEPEKFLKCVEKIVKLDERLLVEVSKGGADFVFLGGPAAEMISPPIYDKYIVPYSQIVTDIAHENGLLIYSHICSPIEPFLTMGYYNKMGIDLFETLSAPPVGNIKSIDDALSKIDDKICTRGNIGLDLLLNATPNEVYDVTCDLIEKTNGRKHIIAASDYLYYDIKIENVMAMSDAVSDYNNN